MIRWLLLAARLFLAGIFLWAAATKLPDMATFATDVANYRLLPPALVPWAASAVVGVEVVVGLALLAGVWLRPAALAGALLLAFFTGGLSQALLRGIDLTCGCFGGNDPATWLTVVRDLAMLVPAVAVAWRGGGANR
ncbi:MAG: DoxX family membrane protein [Deltaproteobacteria bacterium]|nr:DoxX family membrane protein [Deltaproteobacteria bacterium]